MEIQQQKPKFSPITITLESETDAQAFWEIVQQFPNDNENKHARNLATRISNWFSNEAKL